MKLEDAIALIDGADTNNDHPGTWADLGCGSGIFTRALASIVHPKSKIYSVDQSHHHIQPINNVQIKFIQADFEKETLPLSSLQGILMANSLHFVSKKEVFLEKLKTYLTDNASVIIVEYDTDQSNPWVPHPIDFVSLKELFLEAGFHHVEKIGQRKSSYGGKMMYACEVRS